MIYINVSVIIFLKPVHVLALATYIGNFFPKILDENLFNNVPFLVIYFRVPKLKLFLVSYMLKAPKIYVLVSLSLLTLLQYSSTSLK